MPDIILPTLQACKSFGICRTNNDIDAKSRPNTYGFIEGPQSKALFSSENFDFATKFYDTFNYKPNFGDTKDPVHSNLEKGVMDEVILEFLQNKPTRITHREQNGKVIHTEYKDQVKNDIVIRTIRIAPSTTDWLNFSHDQEWGEQGGILQSVVKFLGGLAQSVESLMAGWHNIMSDQTRERRIVKTEFTHEWQGTKHITFDIPFVLFTAGGSIEAFRRDIFEPIMEINKLIYPKRFTSKELSELESEIKQRQRQEQNPSNDPGYEEYLEREQRAIDAGIVNIPEYDEEGEQKTSGETMSDIMNLINLAVPGSRMAFLKPPSHVRVTHSSGLFRFARCAVTNFSYNYKGPWVKTGNDDEWFNKMQSDYSAILGFPNFMSRGFPCIADCKLSIACLDPLYADDWSEIYSNSDIVNISKANTGQIEVIDPVNPQPLTPETPVVLSEDRFSKIDDESLSNREVDEMLRQKYGMATTRPPRYRI